MLLGFISLLLTVSQGFISRICVPEHLILHMLPCSLSDRKSLPSSEEEEHSKTKRISGRLRRLLSEHRASQSSYCATKTHCKANPKFNFYQYMIRALEDDFKHVVGLVSLDIRGGILTAKYQCIRCTHPSQGGCEYLNKIAEGNHVLEEDLHIDELEEDEDYYASLPFAALCFLVSRC